VHKLTRVAIVFSSVLALGAAFVVLRSHESNAQQGTFTGTGFVPYAGYLELDGVAVSSSGVNMVFTLTGPDGSGLSFTYTPVQPVPVYSGQFQVNIGEGGAVVPDWVWSADELYVTVSVEGEVMANSQRIVAVPFSHTATDRNGAFTPRYTNWNQVPVGGGGAAIVNDNVDYDALMIVGNNSAGGNRQVGIWDELRVHGAVTTGDLTANRVNGSTWAPRYGNWNTLPQGDGGAAIVNDNVATRSLMIVGNNHQGGVRNIGMWDYVTIHGGATIAGSANIVGETVTASTSPGLLVACDWAGWRTLCGACDNCNDDWGFYCHNGVLTSIDGRSCDGFD